MLTQINFIVFIITSFFIFYKLLNDYSRTISAIIKLRWNDLEIKSISGVNITGDRKNYLIQEYSLGKFRETTLEFITNITLYLFLNYLAIFILQIFLG